MSNENNSERAKRGFELIIKTASRTAGGIAALSVTPLIGPVGAVASGATVSAVLERVGTDFLNRYLSAREQERVIKGVDFAAKEIQLCLERGEELRQDDFFDRKNDGTSNADEVTEGVLLKCKNEHEEKKLRYLGNIIARSTFTTASVDAIHATIRICENLTYRQLCLMDALASCSYLDERIKLPLTPEQRRQFDLNSLENLKLFEFEALRRDIAELVSLSIIEETYRDRIQIKGNEIVGWQLTEFGLGAYRLMGLNELPREDVNRVGALLSKWIHPNQKSDQ